MFTDAIRNHRCFARIKSLFYCEVYGFQSEQANRAWSIHHINVFNAKRIVYEKSFRLLQVQRLLKIRMDVTLF